MPSKPEQGLTKVFICCCFFYQHIREQERTRRQQKNLPTHKTVMLHTGIFIPWYEEPDKSNFLHGKPVSDL